MGPPGTGEPRGPPSGQGGPPGGPPPGGWGPPGQGQNRPPYMPPPGIPPPGNTRKSNANNFKKMGAVSYTLNPCI